MSEHIPHQELMNDIEFCKDWNAGRIKFEKSSIFPEVKFHILNYGRIPKRISKYYVYLKDNKIIKILGVREFESDEIVLHYKVDVQNGSRHGIEKTFWYGITLYSAPFINGDKHGSERIWNTFGKLKSIIDYENGVQNGQETSFTEDGHPILANNTLNGEPHGIQLSWFESKRLDYIKMYKEGKKHGIHVDFYDQENQQYSCLLEYVDGKKVEEQWWHKDGTECFDIDCVECSRYE